jgi:hypothetical protein
MGVPMRSKSTVVTVASFRVSQTAARSAAFGMAMTRQRP